MSGEAERFVKEDLKQFLDGSIEKVFSAALPNGYTMRFDFVMDHLEIRGARLTASLSRWFIMDNTRDAVQRRINDLVARLVENEIQLVSWIERDLRRRTPEGAGATG